MEYTIEFGQSANDDLNYLFEEGRWKYDYNRFKETETFNR